MSVDEQIATEAAPPPSSSGGAPVADAAPVEAPTEVHNSIHHSFLIGLIDGLEAAFKNLKIDAEDIFQQLKAKL